MSRTARIESRTGIYHVMQRGADKQIIFETERDYIFYLKKLGEYKKEYNIKLLAYCLMENHLHMLVKTESLANLSIMMQRLGTSYARHYNEKYFHAGYVFQGRFRCEQVESEGYLYTCIRYIHNNPVKAGISSRDTYKWSSFNDYLMGKGITDRDIVMSLVSDINAFVKMSNIKDDTEVMDCDHRRLTTKDGAEYVRSKYGFECGENSVIKSLIKSERNAILRDLKDNGYTAKQIERITGVSRAIVYKA